MNVTMFKEDGNIMADPPSTVEFSSRRTQTRGGQVAVTQTEL